MKRILIAAAIAAAFSLVMTLPVFAGGKGATQSTLAVPGLSGTVHTVTTPSGNSHVNAQGLSTGGSGKTTEHIAVAINNGNTHIVATEPGKGVVLKTSTRG